MQIKPKENYSLVWQPGTRLDKTMTYDAALATNQPDYKELGKVFVGEHDILLERKEYVLICDGCGSETDTTTHAFTSTEKPWYAVACCGRCLEEFDISRPDIRGIDSEELGADLFERMDLYLRQTNKRSRK